MALLLARTWEMTAGPGSSEMGNSRRRDVTVEFLKSQSALVVIDPWAHHPNEGWLARAGANIPYLVRLIETFRRAGRPIFYDPTGLEMHPAVLSGWGPHDNLIPWDQSGGGTQDLNQRLIANNVRTIFWGGYATNLCLMSKPSGFREMLKTDWDRQHIIVRDATVAFETEETLAEQRLLDAAIYEVEYYPKGFSSTVEACEAAFS